MSQKQFQVRHNIPQSGLQNTFQGSKAFGLRVSPINVISLSTKPNNCGHRRPNMEDNFDSNSKLVNETHNKKAIPSLRKGLYSRANMDGERKKDLPSIEKLPRSAPNNLNARMHLKQGLRSHGMKAGEDKNSRSTFNKIEDKENDLSGFRSLDKDGLSTQREQKIESQDDVMTEVTSSDGQTIGNENLKTKLSLEGPDMKYNRKYRAGSRGQDNASDQIEEDIFHDKASRDEQLGADLRKNEEESGEEKSWQKGNMDITLSRLTPEKSANRNEPEIDDKEKPAKSIKNRRKDSILTNASSNSTRPESEMQNSQTTPLKATVQRVRGAFTREHIPLDDIKKKQEQKKVMREYLDSQLEEKKRLQAEEKARECEEQKKEEERIKKECEHLLVQGEADPGAQTFGRKRVAPSKKESTSAQNTTVKRPAPRKRTENDIHRIEGENVHRDSRISNGADNGPFNLDIDIDNTENIVPQDIFKHKRILSGNAVRSKEGKANVKELIKENDFLWGENQKKGELIDILMRALKQTDIPLNPLLSPPARHLQTEIPIESESNSHLNLRSHHSKQSLETPLLGRYFSHNLPGEDLMKTQQITSTTNRKTRPYEYPTAFPDDLIGHRPTKIPDIAGFPMQAGSHKSFLPHKPTVQNIQISLSRDMHGYPIKDLVSPLRSPTLTNSILQYIPIPSTSKAMLSNDQNITKGNNSNFYSHTRALTSPDEVLSVRVPLAQIPDMHNINYGISGSTRRADQTYGHYKMGSGENGMISKTISHANETFSKTNTNILDSNILVLEEGLNFGKQESRQFERQDEHLPSLQGKAGLMAVKKAVRSTENKEVGLEGTHGIKGLIPEFMKGKSSGALDQTARFPKEIFGINVKRKF